MIFGLPLQVFTGLGTFLMSYMASKSKSTAEMLAAERKYSMELLAAQSDHQSKVIAAHNQVLKADPYFAWTRRVLAIGGGLGILAMIFLVAFADIPWIFVYDEVPFQLFGINFGIVLKQFVTKVGVPVLFGEAMLHIVVMVFSYYFGNSAGKVKNPYK